MKTLRTLIVEDDAIVAMLLADFLVALGHFVCSVESTQAGAVAAAARDRPDLMIVDARLAEGDGVAAVEHILQAGFIPHVFVSGDALAGRSLHPRAVLIQKPYFEADIIRAIAVACATRAGPR